ncbi:MAG: glycosyltransferase [Blautia sp.]|nr:glycosyltransferase [Blautia sp.]
MKILEINSVCGIGSTGRIAVEIAKEYEQSGNKVVIAYGRGQTSAEGEKYAYHIGNEVDVRIHGMISRLFDLHGFASKRATKQFLKWADQYDPDLLWLHNIHGYYINIGLLFQWIKSRPQMQVQWTLHDCWAFTGHCAHFTFAQCGKWKKQCEHCPQKRSYPKSFLIDCSLKNYNKKRELFCGVKNMTLITPSQWLADLVKESFLGEYPVEVRYNIVDTTVFKPTDSSFRRDHGLEGKIVILGVASVWNEQKGLQDFIALSRMLDERYIIVLIGLNSKQIKALPESIIGLGKMNDMTQLAAAYSAADFFVNPSREETFGLTTVEACACGTTSIVYQGSASEEVAMKYGGKTIPAGVEYIYEAVTGRKYMAVGV